VSSFISSALLLCKLAITTSAPCSLYHVPNFLAHSITGPIGFTSGYATDAAIAVYLQIFRYVTKFHASDFISLHNCSSVNHSGLSKIQHSTKNLTGISSSNLNLAAFLAQCLTVFFIQS
jgi:hypothetical protein